MQSAGKKKDYGIYKICFCINLIVTTHTQRTRTHNIKEEEMEGKVL